VSEFVELFVTFLPSDAGGRTDPIAPRDGTYRPVLRARHGASARVIFLEGPPQIAPGDGAIVVAQFEERGDEALVAGDDLDVVEPGERLVGLATLMRVMRPVISV